MVLHYYKSKSLSLTNDQPLHRLLIDQSSEENIQERRYGYDR